MRNLISLILFWGLHFGVFGTSDCPQELARLAHEQGYTRLGISLASIRPAVRSRLEKVPSELLSPRAPQFEELEKLDVSQWKLPKQLKEGNSFSDPKSLSSILNLFRQVKGDADYLFVGNGYYIPYLMARAAFAGTPMESRIKFVPVSRDLIDKTASNPQVLSQYFKTLGIGSATSPKKVVVIDSITSLESKNRHSIMRTANAVRNYLIEQGWSQEKALRSVIPLAMPEGDPSHSYRTRSLEDYERKIAQVDPKNFQSATLPYLDPGIPFDQGPFQESYSYYGDGHYWNGKYSSLDSFGMPRGIEDIRPGLERMSARELEEFLLDRAHKVQLYQEVIAANKNNARRYQKEIKEILGLQQP